jgi:hypothetical protein
MADTSTTWQLWPVGELHHGNVSEVSSIQLSSDPLSTGYFRINANYKSHIILVFSGKLTIYLLRPPHSAPGVSFKLLARTESQWPLANLQGW